MNKILTITLAALAVATATGVSAHDSCLPAVQCKDSVETLRWDSASGYYISACLFQHGGATLVCPRIPLGEEVLDTVDIVRDIQWGFGGTFDGGTTQAINYTPDYGFCADGWGYDTTTGKCWHACNVDGGVVVPEVNCPDPPEQEVAVTEPEATVPTVPGGGGGGTPTANTRQFCGYFYLSSDSGDATGWRSTEDHYGANLHDVVFDVPPAWLDDARRVLTTVSFGKYRTTVTGAVEHADCE